ncbi:MAG: hypothetical protein Q9208_003309 [Pyrenodesmia sp. 3 TL-2023]
MDCNPHRGIRGPRISTTRLPLPNEERILLTIRTDHFEYRFHHPRPIRQGTREYRRFESDREALHEFQMQMDLDFDTHHLQWHGEDQASVAIWEEQMTNLAEKTSILVLEMTCIEGELRAALGLSEFSRMRREIAFGDWIRSARD